ncbi:hypothetical protein [uncultured Lamprocystis sp.]|jgi:hypothetical protein|uniref:hypothetical protein n=1 Tax=uncultured Lamprocystis sp. TaxID=543132 RepID=UPI0025FF994A|nr:hypothetical protein [uncultured Lamprocystis sp.]
MAIRAKRPADGGPTAAVTRTLRKAGTLTPRSLVVTIDVTVAALKHDRATAVTARAGGG